MAGRKISPQETRYFVLNFVNIPLISEGQNEFTLVTGGLAFSAETYAAIKNRLSLKHKI